MMNSIGQGVARLQVVLQSEEDLYLRMRRLLRQEESELVILDPAVVEATVDQKRALAEEGRLLEESRLVITAQLAQAIGLGTEAVKLSTIIEALAEEAGDLPSLHARLSALIVANRTLLEANESFANRSLARVQDTLRLLGRSAPDEVGYGPTARTVAHAGRGRLVRQAI